MRMRVSSVSYGTGAIHVPKVSSDITLSEFAYRPVQEKAKPFISANGFKKLLLGIAAIAVAVTLSRVKMPFKKHEMDLINILC